MTKLTFVLMAICLTMVIVDVIQLITMTEVEARSDVGNVCLGRTLMFAAAFVVAFALWLFAYNAR